MAVSARLRHLHVINVPCAHKPESTRNILRPLPKKGNDRLGKQTMNPMMKKMVEMRSPKEKTLDT